MKNEDIRKGSLIKESLKIVDELGNLNIEDIEKIENIIKRAKNLKRNVLWKLK